MKGRCHAPEVTKSYGNLTYVDSFRKSTPSVSSSFLAEIPPHELCRAIPWHVVFRSRKFAGWTDRRSCALPLAWTAHSLLIERPLSSIGTTAADCRFSVGDGQQTVVSTAPRPELDPRRGCHRTSDSVTAWNSRCPGPELFAHRAARPPEVAESLCI